MDENVFIIILIEDFVRLLLTYCRSKSFQNVLFSAPLTFNIDMRWIYDWILEPMSFGQLISCDVSLRAWRRGQATQEHDRMTAERVVKF